MVSNAANSLLSWKPSRRYPGIESVSYWLDNLDNNQRYDLTGSYGVKLVCCDFNKACVEAGQARVRYLGPVLAGYHPVVADNVRRLRTMSGLDEVVFHMSGSEAVMQAIRLARYKPVARTATSSLASFSFP